MSDKPLRWMFMAPEAPRMKVIIPAGVTKANLKRHEVQFADGVLHVYDEETKEYLKKLCEQPDFKRLVRFVDVEEADAFARAFRKKQVELGGAVKGGVTSAGLRAQTMAALKQRDVMLAQATGGEREALEEELEKDDLVLTQTGQAEHLPPEGFQPDNPPKISILNDGEEKKAAPQAKGQSALSALLAQKS